MINISEGGALLDVESAPPLHQADWCRLKGPAPTDWIKARVVRHGGFRQVTPGVPVLVAVRLHPGGHPGHQLRRPLSRRGMAVRRSVRYPPLKGVGLPVVSDGLRGPSSTTPTRGRLTRHPCLSARSQASRLRAVAPEGSALRDSCFRRGHAFPEGPFPFQPGILVAQRSSDDSTGQRCTRISPRSHAIPPTPEGGGLPR
ncbi:MAG: hypothetical protein JO355_12110 [Planctomycetaceae bacterium]|nr:hypothetical protein [Planctomycetaceae bacterium]